MGEWSRFYRLAGHRYGVNMDRGGNTCGCGKWDPVELANRVIIPKIAEILVSCSKISIGGVCCPREACSGLILIIGNVHFIEFVE